MNCGCREAFLVGTKVHPDFDTSVTLPPDLHRAFMDRMDGICVNCGLYQAYKRFTPDQVRQINSYGKDITTKEKAFHAYPVPADFVALIDKSYFGLRLRRWGQYLDAHPIRPENCLFLRPYFGAAPKFIQDRFGSRVGGLDMSDSCIRTTCDRIPGFRSMGGIINGMLEGEFLDQGPYDAIFVFHTLIHSIDVHEMLSRLRRILKPGGFALFSHEVTRKPANPFHMVHLSEPQLLMLLSAHFGRVDRIDDCDENPPAFITRFSSKCDSPDFVAWAL
ncbi:MAG: hypothetical protein JWP91_1673 [Fibrobacteres bacterium]|nr:hypothetical protein [Fibrobacterota bacterium]